MSPVAVISTTGRLVRVSEREVIPDLASVGVKALALDRGCVDVSPEPGAVILLFNDSTGDNQSRA